MRGIVTNEERQMIRDKSGWECCGRCDSPFACASNCECARLGEPGDNLGLDIPPERDRTDVHRKDIEVAWLLVDIPECEQLLNSTEGHLAVLRGIQYGRKQERKADALSTGNLVNELIRRLNYDGHDIGSITIAELQRAIDGVSLTSGQGNS